ncbi:MAG: Hsp20/alpha crystallin family protein [Candidatus Scalindua sp.]|nr:Hsp20/alpha crystallin family protein [Candidatus Scalindua sp.]
MTLEKWDPWQEFATLQQSVNELFNEFFTRFITTKEIAFTPQINIYETQNEIMLNVALPGTLQEDIDISLEEEDVLYIRGERINPHTSTGDLCRIEEVPYGYFERKIPLSAKCVSEKMKADYSEGILTIQLSKKAKK